MAKTRSRRHAFTMLEIMIVMILLTMVLGTLGVKGYQAIRQQRFNSSVEALIAKIALAHQVRLCYHADVALHLQKKNDTWICNLTTPQDLPKRLKRFLQRELELRGVHTVQLNHQSMGDDISLCFPSTQRYQMTRGNLWLSEDDNREHRVAIPLRGYPAPLQKTREAISFEELNEASYPNFPDP